MLDLKSIRLAVIGLGYVGLPLAVEFGKKRTVIGFGIIREFQDFVIRVVANDPYAHPAEVAHEYPGVEIDLVDAAHPVDALVVAVAHQEYTGLSATDIKALLKSSVAIVADVKGLCAPQDLERTGVCGWRL